MAEANPLRYRGYYYDRETGFYYLNSRYYDPKIGRFINADSYVSTGQGIVGYNMFAYCGNNPVNREDAAGGFWDTVFDIFSLGVSIADVWNNPTDGWAWLGLGRDVIDLVPFVTGVGEGTKALGVVNKFDDGYDASKAGKATNTLTDAQKSRLNTLDNTIEHNLKETDFSGTLRDLQGNPVPNPLGGYYDHLTEMKQSYTSFNKIKKGLEGSLKNPNLSSIERELLQNGLDKANSYINRIEELFKLFGGIK